MADTKQTIDIVFNGVDKTAGAVASVIGGVEDGANKLKGIAAPIADVTAGVLKFEAAIIASGAALTLFAVKTAGDFDSAFREISTLIDAPIEDLGDFRQAILDYSSNSTQSLDQVTTAIYGAISAGVDYTDSIGTVRQAEQLAVASKANLQDTLVLLVSSLNAYGKGAEDAEHFSDALFTTVKQGQTTLPELAGSLAQVTGIAASAGVPFETLLSAVASLTAAGMPTSQSITSIKAALSNIIKPSSQAADEATRLGIQFNASALQSKGFEGVLEDVKTATGGNIETMGKLFGSVEGLNSVLTLTGTGAEKFTETLGAMEDSSGATATAFGKMTEAIDRQVQIVQNSLKVMLTALGTPLLDEFGGVAQAVAAIFQSIGQSVDAGALGDFVEQIEALARDAEAALTEIARNLPEALETADFSDFLEGIDVVMQAVKSLFDGVDLTSAEGLTHAIEVIGAGFMTLQTFVASAITAIGPFLEVLGEMAVFVSGLSPSTVKLAGSIGGLAIVAGPVLTALTGVTGAIKLVATGILGSGGLATALTAIATSPAGIAAGLTAMAAAAYKTGEAIYGLTENSKEYEAIQAGIQESEKIRADLSGQTAVKLEELSKKTGVLVGSIEELNRLQELGVLVFNEATGEWERSSQAAEDFAKSLEGVGGKLIDWSKSLGSAVDESGNLVAAMGLSTQAVDDNTASAIAAAAAYYEMQGTTPELARRMAELGNPISNVTSVMEDAGKTSEKLKYQLEELASNERTKKIDMIVGLRTTELEAGAKKVEAIMDSIGQSVNSTGDTISSLFGTLSNTISTDTRDKLTDQIAEENRRREELTQAQIEAMKAYAAAMEAKSKAIDSGEGLIKIQSDGLEPALEMILWNVMEKVQLRANEDAVDFLTGLDQ